MEFDEDTQVVPRGRQEGIAEWAFVAWEVSVEHFVSSFDSSLGLIQVGYADTDAEYLGATLFQCIGGHACAIGLKYQQAGRPDLDGIASGSDLRQAPRHGPGEAHARQLLQVRLDLIRQ